MRFKLWSLLLLIALSACSFQVDVIETPLPTATAVGTDTTTSSPIPTADNSATPPPLPTSTALPTTPSIGSTVAVADVLPIVFPANGTAQVMVGNLAQGSSQVYSLTAFQGQTMAVSIWAEMANTQNTFMLEIQGRDGTVLCPIRTISCPFWRGELPGTQEYLIKVTANVGGSFKMRVAINPPGQAHQYFAYDDPQGRYSLSYSDEFAPMNYSGLVAVNFTPEFALQYIDTKQYTKTNLSEAYFLFGSSTDPQMVSGCTALTSPGGMQESLGDVTIDGVAFSKSRTVGVAAGNIYDQISYRGVHQETCYEITYFTHSTNIGNYDPGVVVEFDRDLLLQKFDETLSTLELK